MLTSLISFSLPDNYDSLKPHDLQYVIEGQSSIFLSIETVEHFDCTSQSK